MRVRGVAMRKSPARAGGRGARPESLLAGTATPALLGCPRLQGRWAGDGTGVRESMALHCAVRVPAGGDSPRGQGANRNYGIHGCPWRCNAHQCPSGRSSRQCMAHTPAIYCCCAHQLRIDGCADGCPRAQQHWSGIRDRGSGIGDVLQRPYACCKAVPVM
jgi:hypothetical protein